MRLRAWRAGKVNGLPPAAARPLAASLAAGMVRKDLALEDIRVLVAMLAAGLANAAPGERPKLARRALQFVLDAVRLQT